jgi:hypothetical protein
MKVTASPVLPVKSKAIADFSAVGKEARNRALLEGERRFCGNNSEVLSGAPVELTSRDKLSLLLDPRTVNCRHLEGREGLIKECKDALEKAYIEYGTRAHEYAEETLKSAASFALSLKGKAPAAIAGTAPAAKAAVPAKEEVQKCMWSSDEEEEVANDEIDNDEVAAAAAAKAVLQITLKDEFIRCFRNYRKVAEKLDWRALNASLGLGLDLPAAGAIGPLDLWHVDMGKVMKHLYLDVPGSKILFGFLPKMAIFSRGSIGALGASSFCERINSAANQVVTSGNSMLGTKEINMIVTLRVNRAYMAYMREHHPEVSGQHFKMTVLKLAENKSDEKEGDE